MTDNITNEFDDDIEAFEAKETENRLPKGWLVLFIGLIVWGLFYIAAYAPFSTGWTQAGQYEKSIGMAQEAPKH